MISKDNEDKVGTEKVEKIIKEEKSMNVVSTADKDGTKEEVKRGDQKKENAIQANAMKNNEKFDFEWSMNGLTDEEVLKRRQIYGWNEVISNQEAEWKKIVKRYIGLVPVILFIAAIFAIAVKQEGRRDYLSFSLLMLLINLTVWADYLGERNTKNAIKAVEKLSSPQCRVKRNNVFVILNIKELVPGDIVNVRAGFVIPADGVLIGEGGEREDLQEKNILDVTLTVDESALTGESLYVIKRYMDELLSGAVIQKGDANILITKTGKDSFFGKTLALLSKTKSTGNLCKILKRTSYVITFIAFLFSFFLLFYFIFDPEWKIRISEDRVLLSFKICFVLIASVIPAAMPVVTTTVLAVGAKIMSKENAIVNRLAAIEECAGLEILCTDKTGTLTKNILTLYEEEVVCEKNISVSTVLLMASLASVTNDPEPIDKAINEHVNMHERIDFKVIEFIPFNPVDKKSEAVVKNKNGEVLRIVKGAPHVIRDLVVKNNKEEKKRIDNIINEKAARGLRTLGVAVKKEEGINSEKNEWKLYGYISLFDPPRDDTKSTIKKANGMGIHVKMVTGDQKAIAIETAKLLSMGTKILGADFWYDKNEEDMSETDKKQFIDEVMYVDGFAGLYPEHKYRVVDAILSTKKLVAMTGDGVNDAPALKLATVGIAVSNATDAAKSAADIILLKPGLSAIITAFLLSRQIFKRVESYIIFRIYTSCLILLFEFSSIVFLRFLFPSWSIVLISLINDFTLMSCSMDRVSAAKTPVHWNMFKICFIAIFLAFLGCISIIIFIVISDPSFGINWWEKLGLEIFVADISNPAHSMSSETNGGVWLLLTLLIQFLYHSARTRSFFFIYNEQNLFPSLIVLLPQFASVILTLFLSVYWSKSIKLGSGAALKGIGWKHAGVIVFYALIWFVFMDIVKVLAYKIYENFNKYKRNNAKKTKLEDKNKYDYLFQKKTSSVV